MLWQCKATTPSPRRSTVSVISTNSRAVAARICRWTCHQRPADQSRSDRVALWEQLVPTDFWMCPRWVVPSGIVLLP